MLSDLIYLTTLQESPFPLRPTCLPTPPRLVIPFTSPVFPLHQVQQIRFLCILQESLRHFPAVSPHDPLFPSRFYLITRSYCRDLTNARA